MVDSASAAPAQRSWTPSAGAGRQATAERLAAARCASRPPQSTITIAADGGVRSTTNDASAAPVSPAKLSATTTARYVAPCASAPTTAAGRGTEASSVAFTVASNSDAPPPSRSDTAYERTPAQASTKPAQRTLSAVAFVAYTTTSPAALSTETAPPAGPEQHSFAAADATAWRSPAQLVARTLRWYAVPHANDTEAPSDHGDVTTGK